MFAVVLFHDAFVAEAQVHFGSVGSANGIVIGRARGIAFTSRRHCRRRAGGLQLVAGADFLVAGRSSVDRNHCNGQHCVHENRRLNPLLRSIDFSSFDYFISVHVLSSRFENDERKCRIAYISVCFHYIQSLFNETLSILIY